MKAQADKTDKAKLTIDKFKEEEIKTKDILYKVHTVMDYFSNEFMRLENFIEKYLPLKMQNAISHTLQFVMEPKQKWKLREYDEVKFLELRELLLEDKGMPDLKRECTTVIQGAREVNSKFNGFDQEKAEVRGLQDDRLMKHKHFAILSENMMSLNPVAYKRDNPEQQMDDEAPSQGVNMMLKAIAEKADAGEKRTITVNISSASSGPTPKAEERAKSSLSNK